MNVIFLGIFKFGKNLKLCFFFVNVKFFVCFCNFVKILFFFIKFFINLLIKFIFFCNFIKIFLGNLLSKLIIVKLFGFVRVNWKDFLIVLLLFCLFFVWIILFKCFSIFFFIGFFIKVFIKVGFKLKGFCRILYIFFFSSFE